MFTHVAQAATQYTELQNTLPGGANDLLGVIDNVTNWFFTILLALAVVFVIIAAYKYLMSGGGEEVGAAHKMILYAAVAVAVAVLSRGLVSVTKVLIGGGSSTPADETSGPTNDQSASTFKYLGDLPSGEAVSVFPCQDDGSVPGVNVEKTYFNISKGEEIKAVGINASNPKISVMPCKDGSLTNVMIDKKVYTPLSADAKIDASIKAEHQAALDSGYQLNKSPEVLVPYCPGDGKVVSVYYKGAIYEAPLEMRANSTQMNTYVPNNATASDGASVGNCEDGSAPSPVWLGLQRYYQK